MFGSLINSCIFVPTKRNNMKATLKFNNNEQATKFAAAWSRATSGGHILGDTDVTVYNIDNDSKKFIENYINKLNQ